MRKEHAEGKGKRKEYAAAPKMLKIGVAGCGHAVGTTHMAVMLSGYLSGVLRRSTAVLERNENGSFSALMQILSKYAVTNREKKTFTILGVCFHTEAGAGELLCCEEQGMQAAVVDFGCYRPEIREEYFSCDRCFLMCSTSAWKLKELEGFPERGTKAGKRLEYFASFGSETSTGMAEQALKLRIRRVPWSPEAFVIDSENLAFFEKFLE